MDSNKSKRIPPTDAVIAVLSHATIIDNYLQKIYGIDTKTRVANLRSAISTYYNNNKVNVNSLLKVLLDGDLSSICNELEDEPDWLLKYYTLMDALTETDTDSDTKYRCYKEIDTRIKLNQNKTITAHDFAITYSTTLPTSAFKKKLDVSHNQQRSKGWYVLGSFLAISAIVAYPLFHLVKLNTK